jgi:hypothetical protein
MLGKQIPALISRDIFLIFLWTPKILFIYSTIILWSLIDFLRNPWVPWEPSWQHCHKLLN